MPGSIDGYSETADHGDAAREQAREFMALLWRRALLIGAIVALALVGATTFTLLQTPKYRAVATLEVQREEAQIIRGADVQPATIADSEHMMTQIALLRSRSLAMRVVEELNLEQNPNFVKQNLPRADRVRLATNAVVRNLEVTPFPRSRVLEVRFKNPSAKDASAVANAIAETFIQSTLERRYNATAYARNFLEERLRATKEQLEQAERKLIEYSRQQQIIDLRSAGGSETGASLDANALLALNEALTNAQEQRITAQQKFLEATKGEKARDTLENEAIVKLRGVRAELSADYQQKLVTFKPDYPTMVELQSRIDVIDREIAKERNVIVLGLKAALEAATAREDALRSRVEELKNDVQNVQSRSVDYNILAREVESLRSQYNALLQRFKEVSIASGIGASQVSLVDAAEPPRQPFEPKLRFALLISLGAGLLLGVVIALMVEYVDDTIRTPDDLKNKLGLPILGVVPKLKGGEKLVDQLEDPRSPASEAFSSARTALQFVTEHGAPRSILITGTRPAEGKTSTTTGLALAFAAVGRRVLIIDADMRRPSFQAPVDQSIGLSGLLTREVPLQSQVVAGQAPNLFLLPAGVVPPNPAEILSTSRISAILEEAVAAFDVVLVDAPPILDFADSPLLGSVCEATVMVVQSKALRRRNVLRALERLRAANAFVAGGILSKFDVQRTGYGYSYGYAYKYGYGSQASSQEREALVQRRMMIFLPKDDHDSGQRP